MADEGKGLTIAGEEYPLPTIDTFDMDEAMILYESCRLTLEDFAIDEEDDEAVEELGEKCKHPGFFKALMQVAYMRGNRGVSAAKAKAIVGKENSMQVFMEFLEAGVDALPPAEAPRSSELSSSSLENSDSSNGSSGHALKAVSDEPAASLEATTTTDSDTSATLDLENSAA